MNRLTSRLSRLSAASTGAGADRFAPVICALAVAIGGCAPQQEPQAAAHRTSAATVDSRARIEPADDGQLPAETAPANLPTEADRADSETRYDGRTLDEWRRRMKDLDPDDPAAATAVAGLMEIVRDAGAPRHTRQQAALTLGRIGPEAKQAVPLLVELLDETGGESESGASVWAAKALALFGPAAKEAAPRLIRRLNDRSAAREDRLAALEALSQIGTAHPGVVPTLIERLNSPREDAFIRALTAESLGNLESRAATAVPALLRAARDDDENLRRAAAAAMGSIGPAADVALPTLGELLVFDESPAVRDQAAAALAGIGPAAVELLTRLLADKDAEVRWRAAQSLGKIGRPAAPALPALTQALEDDDAQVRMHAIEATWAVRPEAEPLLPFLLAELTGEDRQIRMRAVRMLESMGDDARSAIEPLKTLSLDERPFVRQAARKALESLTDAQENEETQ